MYLCVCVSSFLVDIKEEEKKKEERYHQKDKTSHSYNHLKNMKLIRVTFLLCALAILLLLTPISSLQLNPRFSSPSQGSSQKIAIKMASRKLMIISSEHVNVMTSTVHEGSSEQLEVTSSDKSKNDEKKLSEEEEEKALSKYLSMDYPKFRRRRPVHNKSLPRSP